MSYDYCKRPGHIKEKRYRLHYFSPNIKFTKGKNATSAAYVHTWSIEPLTRGTSTIQDGASGSSAPSNPLQHLIKEQHDQLMQLLESFHVGSPFEGSNTITSRAVNFVGILTCYTHSEIMKVLSHKYCH